ncbi:DUF4351 domain-containing protein [Thiorhodospira sibirica]|uniref:DUF4351 domain-containing protein n=1 Tax=Thiorhodospira sibirica TaxID=154347 RepID=UPI00022C5DD7|nr:DUF4351 domain-containing protein [Thiorhodospira sibirica]
MPYASVLIKHWESKGERRGRQKGLREGEKALLRRQLLCRFGALPEELEQRLEQAEPEEIEYWAERILDAPDLAAVFAEAG